MSAASQPGASAGPAPGPRRAGPSRESWLSAVLAAVFVGAGALIQSTAYPNQDFAYLSWANGPLLGGRRFGVDFFESNPPLAILIYAPGWLMSRALGSGAGVKLWVVFLAVLSLGLVAKAATPRVRPWITGTLACYFAFAFTREFGQREQLALLLCAPYVTGHLANRRLAALSGVMAGLGFAIKPYFLVALALVWLSRPRLRTEELAIAATGLVYALLLATAFRSYALVMAPLTREVYWAFDATGFVPPLSLAFSLHAVLAILLWLMHRDRSTLPFLAAALGFGIAAALQFKWYSYHCIAAWGFLILFVAAQAAAVPRLRFACLAALLVFSVPALRQSWTWLDERDRRNREIGLLLAELETARSYSAISVHPYPASPTMLYTRTPLVSVSNGHWFLPAAAKIASGESDRPMGAIGRRAIGVALAELRRRPDLVIVNPDWRSHSNLRSRAFDGLAWLQRDARFRQLWRRYAPAGKIGQYRLYRLSRPAPDVEPAPHSRARTDPAPITPTRSFRAASTYSRKPPG